MLLAIDKPHGWTSYDCIRYIKHKFPKQKIWHAGTLDPYATGLLIVAIGHDTKKLNYRLTQHKTYQAMIDLSQSSDTRDLQYWSLHHQYKVDEWSIIKNGKKIAWPNIKTLQSALQALVPQYSMAVPAFSAKKIKWTHSYDLARSGTLITQNKIMIFDKIQIMDYTFPLLQLEVTVWSGTYIRSLAYRIWQHYGLWGILTNLRRLSIGPITIPTINTYGDNKLFIGEIVMSDISIDI